MSLVAARIVPDFDAHNAVNVRTVDVYIQDSPGAPGDKRGVEGLQYEVLSNDQVIQTGLTDKEGKIQVFLFPEARTILKVLGTEYEISITNAAFGNVNTTKGKKERLRYLGYQIGHDGANGNGVDDEDERFEYERSILDFQADHGLDLDSDRSSIEAELRNQAGG